MRAIVTINGRQRPVDALTAELSHARLCLEAGVDARRTPTVTWSLPDGRSGSLQPGQWAPLVKGGVYNVMVTGRA